MKNFEKRDYVVRNMSILTCMIEASDPKQLLRFCQDGQCDGCLFAPSNYRDRFGSAQQGCYRNKIEWLFREAE